MRAGCTVRSGRSSRPLCSRWPEACSGSGFGAGGIRVLPCNGCRSFASGSPASAMDSGLAAHRGSETAAMGLALASAHRVVQLAWPSRGARSNRRDARLERPAAGRSKPTTRIYRGADRVLATDSVGAERVCCGLSLVRAMAVPPGFLAGPCSVRTNLDPDGTAPPGLAEASPGISTRGC